MTEDLPPSVGPTAPAVETAPVSAPQRTPANRKRTLWIGLLSLSVVVAVAVILIVTRPGPASHRDFDAGSPAGAEHVLGQNMVGKPLPTVTFPLMSGGTGAFPTGKPLVVNFWSSSCPPCAQETPMLQRLSVALADRVEFIGIDVMDPPAAARAFIEEFGVTYPQAVDAHGKLALDMQTPGLPTTLVVDRGGVVRWMRSGAVNETQLRQAIEKAG
jgi:cytochrome c biogenesis protein CcmG/thiol:disulfide interchange protein DsbE